MGDPRIQDPSNGGTAPQNYVNVASSCLDKTFPSIYYFLRQGAAPAEDVIMFRWRVEQIANNYATGPSAGTAASTDPWSSALWTVLFDVDGDGYRDLAAHLDGSSGAPATAVDRIFGIWGNLPTQSIDYTADPTIHLIAHNPTAFVGPTNRILNFHNTLTPDENWPNGAGERNWDYGTSRARLITTNSCNEYFIDYQIPVALLDASGLGGPRITRNTPISMLFCTANSLNNPFQKDCAINKRWVGDAGRPAPFGDYLSFNQTGSYRQPIVSSVTASGPPTCPGTYTLTAKVQDTIAIVNGVAAPTVKAVDFHYYYDANGNGLADDGSAWIPIAPAAALASGTLNTWTLTWNATSLPKGKYLIGVQAVDTEYVDNNRDGVYDAATDTSLLDDGMTPTETKNRTFSYLTQAEVDALGGRPVNENWFANPDVTGTQTALIGVALNTCGVAPTMTKTATPAFTTVGAPIDFTITLTNPLSTPLTVSRIDDILPPGFSYASNQPGGTLTPTTSPSNGASGTISWTFSPAASVAPNGGTATLVWRALASSVTGSYSNTAAAATSFGIVSSPPAAIAVGAPRLTLSKSADAMSCGPGSTVNYTIIYSNDSPVDLSNVTISDTIPAGLAYVPGSASDGGLFAGSTITWTVGPVAASSGARTVSFQTTVDNPYTGPFPLVNTATITSTQTAPLNASASVFVNVPRPNVVIQKTADKSLVDPAGTAPTNEVTFVISYTNNGTAAANALLITDTVPGGFTYRTASPAPLSAPAVGGTGTVTWNIATVAAGASGSVTLTVRATSPYPSTANNPQTNTASASWTGGGPVTDSASVGIRQSGNVCSTYYFRDNTASVGFDGVQRSASTFPTPQPADIGGSLLITVPGGANNYSLTKLLFYQEPASSSDVSFGGSLTSDIYIDRKSGPPITLRGTVFDYNSLTGAKTQLGQSAQSFQGSQSGLFSFTIPLSGTLRKDHRLLWQFEATSDNAQSTDLLFQYDGTVPNSVSDTTPPISSVFADSRAVFCVTPPANLVLAKSASAVSVQNGQAGQTISYTIDYANTSSSTGAANVVLTDVLPIGTTYASSTPAATTHPGVGNNGTVTWNLGNLAGAVSGSVSVTVNVNNILSGISSLVNTASIVSDQTVPITATATTSVKGGGSPDGIANIVITKSADKTLLKPGDTVTYTLTVLNAGDGAAANIAVTDDIPDQAYFSYVAGSISGGDSRGTAGAPVSSLNWTVNGLTPGQSAVLSFGMLAGGSAPNGLTTLDNAASLIYEGGGSGAASSNTVTVSVSTNPNLSITKTANPNAGLIPGDTVTFSITVTNTGTGTATDVTVSDPVPANMSFNAVTVGTGSFDAVNNRVVFTPGTLGAGASASLAYTATVSQIPAGTTTLSNTATVTSSNASSRTANATAGASAVALLSVSKSGPAQIAYPAAVLAADASNTTAVYVNDTSQLAVGQTVMIGGGIFRILGSSGTIITLDSPATALTGTPVIGAVTYAITYQNTGTAPAASTLLTDTLPAGSTFVSATGGSHTGGTVTWNLGTVNPGVSGTVQVTIIPGGPGPHVNNAAVTCSSCGLSLDSVSTNAGGLRVAKRTTTPVATAPGSATYVIEVVNTTSSPATNITITDILPTGFSYATTGSILINGVPATAGSMPGVGATMPTWSGFSSSINPASALELTFTASIAGSVGAATYQNDVTTTASNASVTPFDPLLTTDEDVTVLASGTGLITGRVFQDVDNNGAYDPAVDAPIAGVSVVITDSTNTLYIAATDSAGFFTRVVAAGNASVDINNAGLPAGLVLGPTFSDPSVVAVPDGGSVSKDTGYISSFTLADLTITKSHTGNFTQGQAGATYTITVTNIGAGPTSGAVTVTESPPAGLTVTGMSGTGWSCVLAALTCTRSDVLAAGLSYPSITVTVGVASNAAASVTNSATVSVGGELNTGNNTASDSTTVTALADVAINLVAPVTSTTGNTVNVQLTFSNLGPSTATGVTYTLTLNPGLAGVSCTGSGVSCLYALATGVVTVSGLPLTLTSGQSVPFTLSYTAPSSGSVPVTAAITTTSSDANLANNSSTGSTVVLVADVTTTVTAPAEALPGATVTVPVSFGNVGQLSAAGVTYSASLPSGLSGVSCAGATCSYDSLTGAVAITGLPGSLSSGQTVVVILSYTAPASGSVTVGSAITTTTNQGVNAAPDSAGGSTTVNAGATSADVTTTVNPPATAVAGSIVDVPVSFTNLGSASAAGMAYGATLPAGLGVGAVSCNGPVGLTCIYDNITGAVTITGLSGTLTSGQTETITITYSAPGVPGTVVVTSGVGTSTGQGANIGPDTATGTTNITAAASAADVSTTAAPPASAIGGNTVNVPISFSNNGPAPASGVAYGATLPAGLGVGAVSCSGPVGLTCAYNNVTGAVTITGLPGTLTSGQAISITLSYTAPASGTVTVISVIGTSTTDSNPDNNTASSITTIVALADMTVAKSHTGNFTQGQTGATYSITVTNVGAGPISGTVTVTDTLPAGLTATGMGGTGWSCMLAALTCTRSDVLGVGLSYPSITVTVDVAGNAAASVTNSATVSGGGELNTLNNTATDPTIVIALAADVAAGIVAPVTATTGSTVNVQLTFSNLGLSTATGVTYTLTLNPGLDGVSCTGSGVSCLYALAAGTVALSGLPTTLNSGQSVPFTLSYTTPASGAVTVQSAVSTATPEGNLTNNSATGNTTITVIPNGNISGVVYNDLNGNGTQDAGEPGMAGVTVTLRDSASAVIATTVTDANGNYSFLSLTPGAHSVTETDQTGFVSTTPNTVAVNVLAGGTATLNFGDQQVVAAIGSVTGTVFNDLNGNGTQDAGEPGLPGVTITLRSNTNVVVATTTTDANGNYSFLNLQPGVYSVVQTPPPGFVSTTNTAVLVSVAPGGPATAIFGNRQGAAVAVPTMTEWGMMVFMLLAGLAALRRIRGRGMRA